MANETITIKLKKPIIAPEGEVTQLVFREPTFDEYLVHGDPYTVAASQVSKTPFMVENAETISTYIKLLLVEPKNPALLRQGNARLAKEVKEAVLGFFHPDVTESEGSAT